MDIITLVGLLLVILFVFRFMVSLLDSDTDAVDDQIKKRYLEKYPAMTEDAASYLQIVYDRCVQEYHTIVSMNPKIDAGHSVNHVKTVEQSTFVALHEFLKMIEKPNQLLIDWVNRYYGGDMTCLSVPVDVVLRTMVTALFHEVGDNKFKNGTVEKTKAELITEALNRVFVDYDGYNNEFRQDIINSIEYGSASSYGDRIPSGSKVYQLITRWADRLEATGIIGIVRTILFSYSKKSTGYSLCLDTDDFPTSLEELETMAPESRWNSYSTGKKSSPSGFAHYLDKIVHISGKDVPIPFLQEQLNEGQTIVKQYVIDFTVKNGKQFDITWLINHLNSDDYAVEIKQLEEAQDVLRDEQCKWVM